MIPSSNTLNPALRLPAAGMKSAVLGLTAAAGLLLAPHRAEAAVVITNLQLTTTSISFDVSGTLPALAAVPPTSAQGIFVVNPVLSASPGFALNTDFLFAISASFTGTQVLRTGPAGGAILGGPGFGDYGVFNFSADLGGGESLAGTFSATWSAPIMNPAAVTSLGFYWGMASSVSPVGSGTFLGSAAVNAVPESSGAALLAGGLAAAAGRRRRTV